MPYILGGSGRGPGLFSPPKVDTIEDYQTLWTPICGRFCGFAGQFFASNVSTRSMSQPTDRPRAHQAAEG